MIHKYDVDLGRGAKKHPSRLSANARPACDPNTIILGFMTKTPKLGPTH